MPGDIFLMLSLRPLRIDKTTVQQIYNLSEIAKQKIFEVHENKFEKEILFLGKFIYIPDSNC